MYQGFRVFISLQYLSPVFNETRPERVLATTSTTGDNRRRKHSTNGMKSPIDYETEHRKLQSETAEAA